MSEGWIKIHRKLQDNPLWSDEPFSRGQAWVDLLLVVNHKDGFIRINGERIEIKRGQTGRSILTLSKRWKWSRGKATRFLKELQLDGQIILKTNTKNSMITICKYEEYQGRDTTNDTPSSTTNGHQVVQQTDTNKNINNINNDKEKNNPSFQMIEIWNQDVQPKLTSGKTRITEPRKKRLSKLLENEFKTMEGWRGYCQQIINAPFLLGKNDKGWKVDLDWVLEEKNLVRIMEGKYNNNNKIALKDERQTLHLEDC